MSSNHNTTEVTNPGLTTASAPAPVVVPVPRPFVMPKLIKQGKVATLTGDDFEGGGSDIPLVDVP